MGFGAQSEIGASWIKSARSPAGDASRFENYSPHQIGHQQTQAVSGRLVKYENPQSDHRLNPFCLRPTLDSVGNDDLETISEQLLRRTEQRV